MVYADSLTAVSANSFVDQAGCRSYADGARKRLEARLAPEKLPAK